MFNSLFLCLLDPNAPNVVVTKLTLVCTTAPGPLELDLTGKLGNKSSPSLSQSWLMWGLQGGPVKALMLWWAAHLHVQSAPLLDAEPGAAVKRISHLSLHLSIPISAKAFLLSLYGLP